MEVNFTAQMTRRVVVEEQSQVGQARREAQQLARELGFDEVDAGRAALVSTELATNILKHGRGGQLFLSAVAGAGCTGMELCAMDRGPGFSLASCLQDGYSTGGTQGIGLGTVQRQTQWLDAYSDAAGAVVCTRLYPQANACADRAYGGWRLPLRDELVSGDAWLLSVGAQSTTIVMVDGLGHGAAAARAADAGMIAAHRQVGSRPAALLGHMHGAMSGTRGGAVAIAQVDRSSGTLLFAGIGNIGASLVEGPRSRGLPSLPGIVGVGPPRPSPREFAFEHAAGNLLVMHSDGLQGRWSLNNYPGLSQRHPAMVAAVLIRDFDRGRDDTALVVAKLGPEH